ncbi:glycosyltransferase [Cellulomonas cellasea]|uniref:Glycosyltransferase 2-like domain-containing protein n=1 Tax=Cellulomonas cellasea TaxID=43670 RepID=A0A7W4UDS1_9CELL|nr:glycosyltransferase [Cellulomonas cellasea]MBB2921979.1 hypothetical protein [Cellulomonas cellasea]
MGPHRLPLTYVLPLRWTDDDDLEELTAYLRGLAGLVQEVLVVDGSPPLLHAAHARAWHGLVRHEQPDPWPGCNGKVAGVMTGVRLARHEHLVLADDDVRHDRGTLTAIDALLDGADAVRPQNYFDPLPWHAVWDSGRTLLNRALGADYPGTLGVRRSTLLATGGYDGDVLFENLELLRTVRAAGGREVVARDVLVARRPPTARHFAGQRVRQAYDSLGQPARLVAELALAPVLVWAGRSRARTAGVLAAVLALAERGRRRDGGSARFPARCTLGAPVWVLERAVCVWVALGMRVRGGVPYAGQRVLRATSPGRARRARCAAARRERALAERSRPVGARGPARVVPAGPRPVVSPR